MDVNGNKGVQTLAPDSEYRFAISRAEDERPSWTHRLGEGSDGDERAGAVVDGGCKGAP